MPGHSQGTVLYSPASNVGHPVVHSPVSQRQPVGFHGSEDASRVDSAPHSQPVGPIGYLSDRTEDWSSFIQFDQEDTVVPSGTLSYAAGYGDMPGDYVEMPNSDMKPMDIPSQQDLGLVLSGVPNGASNPPAETDEGRHRTHPLYNEGARPDGLYHCPFETEPSCQHKPTKLKCNYDKFIDSHLKPFRCKVDACAKQEFSSTACLLRHEREAHGMHGHGDRPHLCYYPGCERGMLGNGFPRRYNLFDHMRRVHDHKDDPTSLTASPDPAGGESHSQKRGGGAGGRKRKASGPPTAVETTAQRRKASPSSARPAQVPLTPSAPSAPSASYSSNLPHLASSIVSTPQAIPSPYVLRKAQDRERLYSQWASQRDLLARQMEFVRSPDDEMNLQRLSRDLEALRRLSLEANLKKQLGSGLLAYSGLDVTAARFKSQDYGFEDEDQGGISQTPSPA
ncbi:hypothetical protein B0A50_08139 [Salinomyces thailandicus]|uniref:Uncharacterized protein n=1 Tax=Salinomyces thailandicus TaxID=706561 RepID=A0A4V6WJM5_9PEZI|nr:hypothetical protein B0A50_08139 [Salinomyces thailandica]